MRSLSKNKNTSNIILFPKNRIVEKSTTEPKKDQKFLDELHRQQTKEFVETSVDDISLNLLKRLYDMDQSKLKRIVLQKTWRC